jgi:hypothetical protein
MKKSNECMMNEWNTYLKNMNSELRVCGYCNKKITFNTSYTIEGVKAISCFTQRLEVENKYMFKLYSNDEKTRSYYQKMMRKGAASKAGKKCQELHYDKIKNNLNTGDPWNKGMTGLNSWSKGLTKENTPSLMRLSNNRKGAGNPMFGIQPSIEAREKQSKRLRQRILEGSFTPNTHNSRTHKMIHFNGHKYRSSWEVLFAYFHTECEYEKTRIPYTIKDKNKIYITDFTDENNKIIYEIKPECHINKPEMKYKIKGAVEWCLYNGYEYKLITEKELFDNINENVFDIFDNTTKILLKRAYETYKKNRNNKT